MKNRPQVMHRLACMDCGQVGGLRKSAGTPRQPSDFEGNCTVSACMATYKCSAGAKPGNGAPARPGVALGCHMFAGRTRVLPCEKTRRPTRLSGHFAPKRGPGNLGTGPTSNAGRQQAGGAAGRNRTCDPLLRREMLYPLSYSRAGRKCSKWRRQPGPSEKARRLPKAPKRRTFPACEGTLYRGARPILSLVRASRSRRCRFAVFTGIRA